MSDRADVCWLSLCLFSPVPLARAWWSAYWRSSAGIFRSFSCASWMMTVSTSSIWLTALAHDLILCHPWPVFFSFYWWPRIMTEKKTWVFQSLMVSQILSRAHCCGAFFSVSLLAPQRALERHSGGPQVNIIFSFIIWPSSRSLLIDGQSDDEKEKIDRGLNLLNDRF